MFGLFERGSRSFSIILLVAVFVLVFFSQSGSFGPMRSNEGGGSKRNKEDDTEAEKDEPTILYSRVVGKSVDQPKKEVLEAVTEEPKNQAQVLFSRTISKDLDKEKAYNVLYSRPLGSQKI